MMKISDFEIGKSFWMSNSEWRCTDIGSRVITAIKRDHKEWLAGDQVADIEHWYGRPPYTVAEYVIDEEDQRVCYPTKDEHDNEA